MSDMPDFENMSPEEAMRWMESLAKRQGADEGFTTDADMQVEEVDENDERLAGMGEYKPYGMSDEDWEKLKAKEQAEKEAKRAARQQEDQSAATPEPEPEPAQATAAAASGEVDPENMSPEELMRWMESLAARQGAIEGFTTTADMEVAEVDENDERLAGMGEYKPYGMSDEEWEKMKAKEEAEKQARLAARQQQQATPPPAPEPEPEPEPEPAQPAAAAASGEVDPENMSPEELMRWMESLAARQGAIEGFTTTADMEVAEVDENDERLAGMGEYKPYGMSDEEWEKMKAKEEAEKQARLAARQQQQAAPTPATDEEDADDELAAALAGDVLAAPDFDDIFGGNNEISGGFSDDDDDTLLGEPLGLDLGDDDAEMPAAEMPDFDALFGDGDDDAEEPAVEMPDFDALFGDGDDDAAAEPAADLNDLFGALEQVGDDSAGDNPMEWLSGLAGEESSDQFDLSALSELAGGGEETRTSPETEDPMGWLAGLADSGGDDMDEPEEGSMEWMDSLARAQGADEEELITGADFDIPMPESFAEDDGPGYEPYSLENATGTPQDEDDSQELPVPNFDAAQIDMDDPEAWLNNLAEGVAGQTAEADEEDDLDLSFMEDLAADDAVADATTEDSEEVSEDYAAMRDRIKAKLDSNTATPDEIAMFFGMSFDEAAKRPDKPYIDEDDDDSEAADDAEAIVEAEIPDWLAESMSAPPQEDAPSGPAKTDTAEMMIAQLGLDDTDGEIEGGDIPDWLAAEVGEEDSGDIADIFTESPVASVEADSIDLPDDAAEDSWVDAFVGEEDGSMEAWYQSALQQLEGAAPVEEAPAAPAEPITLQTANLPMETTLQLGNAMMLPDWMADDAEAMPAQRNDSQEIASIADADMPDWLSMGDDGDSDEVDLSDVPDEIPAWLSEQVDDTVTEGAELPDWLEGEDLNLEAEDIPDWLKETMEEEESAVDSQAAAAIAELDLELEAEPPAPQPQTTAIATRKASPAPVPAFARDIDVAATLQAAESAVSSGEIDTALNEYEKLLRANAELDKIEAAMDKLANDKDHKKNPGIYRILGDAHMRQGNLQEALDTYRRALNLL